MCFHIKIIMISTMKLWWFYHVYFKNIYVKFSFLKLINFNNLIYDTVKLINYDEYFFSAVKYE